MNKRILVLFIAFTLTGTLAQAQINQADKLFKSYSYSLAIPYYLKIAQKPGNPDYNYAVVRLADCYRLVNDQLNAKAWYAKAVDSPETESINWFYYGEALRCAQEYDLAEKAFNKYNTLNPDDPRGSEYAAFCKEIPKLNQIPANFEVKPVPVLNSERSDFGPVFYDDGIIFVSDRRQNFMENKKYEWTNFNYLDLYFASPKYPDEFFREMNEPKAFTGKFNQTYHDGPASFARGDSLIYFTRTDRGKEAKDSDNFRTDRLKIFWSKYDGSWSKTEPFFLNSEQYSVGHPILTPDGNGLYFVSDMPGGTGGTDIYYCNWEGTQWGQPENIGAPVNTGGNEMFPAVSGNSLYFSSNRLAGFGGLDLFRSTKTNDKWSKPENLGLPINSSFDDFAMVLDSQGRKGFFSSNRPGGLGSDDIYACRLIDPKNRKPKTSDSESDLIANQLPDSLAAEVTGFVKDKQTGKPLQGSTVFLLDGESGKVTVLKTDANGQFKAPVKKGTFYVAKGMENNYLSDCLNFKFETTDTAHAFTTPRDLYLDFLEVNKVFSVRNMDYSIETIYYDFNKWFIREDAEKELDKLVQVMKENPLTVELGSHTDSRGSKEFNLDLSQKRAEAAVRYIVLQGIESTRISAKGYGESQPMNRCSDGVPCTASEHQANRRTEFKVTGFTKSAASPDYDMNKFIPNEEIPVYMFDRDFFINCLQEKRMADKQSGANQESSSSASIGNTMVQTPSKESALINPEIIKKPAETPKPSNSAASVTTQKPTFVAPAEVQVKEAVNPPAGTVTYRVQLLALSREKSLLDPEFEELADVQMYREDGLFKYTTGVFSTHEEALNHRSAMVDLGYWDAFVVTFTNGKRIYISPAY